MDFEGRRVALSQFAEQLHDDAFSKKLVSAYMKDTSYLKRDVVEREINAPIAILKQAGVDTPYTMSYDIDISKVGPIGKVAVLLPYNGINILVAKAICTSFLIGNRTIVKLPRKLRESSPYYRQLISSHLPGIEFAPDDQPAEKFLHQCISSAEISTIVIYGDDKWIWSYKNDVRKHNTRLIFEGPGKDPQVVMKDADLELAVSDAVKCGLLNGGQSCSAAERFFIHEEITQEFTERLIDKIGTIKIGRSEDEEARLGPINSDGVINRMIAQLIDARQKGAQVLAGGAPVEVSGTGKSSFLPTVITSCTTDMRIMQEENFGPLFPILSFSSEAELMSQVDHCNYGLNASIYGTPSEAFADYMEKNHRNLYFNSTVTSAENSASRVLDGGFRNSGFVWEWKNNNFLQREGPRMLLKELSLS